MQFSKKKKERNYDIATKWQILKHVNKQLNSIKTLENRLYILAAAT